MPEVRFSLPELFQQNDLRSDRFTGQPNPPDPSFPTSFASLTGKGGACLFLCFFAPPSAEGESGDFRMRLCLLDKGAAPRQQSEARRST